MSTRTERLVDYIWMNQRRRFVLGEHDCVLFVVRWVDGELGTDYERRVREMCSGTGLTKMLKKIRKAGGYRDLVHGVTGVAPVVSDTWSPGAIAIYTMEDHTESIAVLSKRLLHAPARDSLVSMSPEGRVLCHWSLECLRH